MSPKIKGETPYPDSALPVIKESDEVDDLKVNNNASDFRGKLRVNSSMTEFTQPNNQQLYADEEPKFGNTAALSQTVASLDAQLAQASIVSNTNLV